MGGHERERERERGRQGKNEKIGRTDQGADYFFGRVGCLVYSDSDFFLPSFISWQCARSGAAREPLARDSCSDKFYRAHGKLATVPARRKKNTQGMFKFFLDSVTSRVRRIRSFSSSRSHCSLCVSSLA